MKNSNDGDHVGVSCRTSRRAAGGDREPRERGRTRLGGDCEGINGVCCLCAVAEHLPQLKKPVEPNYPRLSSLSAFLLLQPRLEKMTITARCHTPVHPDSLIRTPLLSLQTCHLHCRLASVIWPGGGGGGAKQPHWRLPAAAFGTRINFGLNDVRF